MVRLVAVLVACCAGRIGAFRPAPRFGTLQTRRVSTVNAIGEEGPTESCSDAFAVGDSVRVVAKGVTLYHSPKHKKGLDPNGFIGTVTRIATVDRTDPTVRISANRAICVKFDEPKIAQTHFDAEELQRLDGPPS